MQATANGLDYLVARLHGRRSRMAEAARLDELCRLQSVSELIRTIYPQAEFPASADFQRQLLQDLVEELSEILGQLTGAGRRLLAWMLTRFQVENLKVLLRGYTTGIPSDKLQAHFVLLPGDFGRDTRAVATAHSLEELLQRMPEGRFREALEKAVGIYGPRPFFLEAALDQAYFEELLARAESLAGQDKAVIKGMVVEEVDIFHLMLVVRGKFHYGLEPELLLPLHLEGTALSRARFAVMLRAPDLHSAASRAVHRVLEFLPEVGSEAALTIEPSALEALAWNRFGQLANRAFRQSHMGLGAVVGYLGIRRVEVANLITLSEGIRAGVAREALRARLIPRSNLEPAYA